MADNDNIVRLVDLATIEADAAGWVARLDRPEVSEADRAAFSAWLEQAEAHRAAYERLSGVWSDMDSLNALAPPARLRARRRRRAYALGWPASTLGLAAGGLAASVAVAAIALVLVAARPGTPPIEVYGAPLGRQQVVLLSDGSRVQLNTDSRIEVRYTRDRRDLRLLQGEAYFEVAPNKHRPFSVYAGDDVVQAVGTAFAVRLKGDTTEVTLTRGVVEVAAFDPGGPIKLDRTPTLVRRPLGTLSASPGAAVHATVVEDRLLKPVPVALPEIDRQLAWRQGMLAFAGETLDTAVAEVDRYTDVDVEIADPRLKHLRVAGYFKAGDVDSLLEALQASFGVRVQWVDPRHVRLSAQT